MFWNKKYDLNRYCDWDHIILLRINSRFYQTEREHSTVDWYHVSLAICTVNEIHHLHAVLLALNDIDALNSVFKTSPRFRVGFVEDFLIRPCDWKLRFSLYCSKWLPHIQKWQILLFCKYTRYNHCKEDPGAWYPAYQNFCLLPLRVVLHSIEYAYIRKPALMSGNFILKQQTFLHTRLQQPCATTQDSDPHLRELWPGCHWSLNEKYFLVRGNKPDEQTRYYNHWLLPKQYDHVIWCAYDPVNLIV